MPFTKLQRNQLFEVLAKSNLDPNECELTIAPYDSIKIEHNSGSWCQITGHNKMGSIGMDRFYTANFAVADGENSTLGESHFGGVVSFTRAWATQVKLVTETPDYWMEAKRSPQLVAAVRQPGSGNRPFSEDEQRQIAAHVQEIKNQVQDRFGLTSGQMEQLSETLDEVVEASKRMDRKDWLIYFLGTTTALIITATVPAGVGEHVFTMVIQGLIHLFTGGAESPGIPG